MSDRDPEPTHDAYSTPRWVKVFGMIALVIIALILVLMLMRGPGGHGPARHRSGGGAAVQPHPAGAVADAGVAHGSTL